MWRRVGIMVGVIASVLYAKIRIATSARCRWGSFFFSSRRRHTRFDCDWSSDVCSSDLGLHPAIQRHYVERFSALYKKHGIIFTKDATTQSKGFNEEYHAMRQELSRFYEDNFGLEYDHHINWDEEDRKSVV